MRVSIDQVMAAQKDHLEVEADPLSGSHCKSAYWEKYTRTLDAYLGKKEISEPPC